MSTSNKMYISYKSTAAKQIQGCVSNLSKSPNFER